MRRYRLFAFDMDPRSDLLQMLRNSETATLENANYQRMIKGLKLQFGELNFDNKLQNLFAIGSKPHSVVAYHNKLLEQIRNSFVLGSFYPALVGACALGERILNHLLINLRDRFKLTPEYKGIYKKDSFANWDVAIKTLSSWKILLPTVTSDYGLLKKRRNDSVHFNLDTEESEKKEALEAITLIQNIIWQQFSGFGDQPWFITDIPGEIYIKSSWESNPFIQLVYLPSSFYVGYKHTIERSPDGLRIKDDFNYEEGVLTDEEFSSRKKNGS